jgi:hypothetical protein
MPFLLLIVGFIAVASALKGTYQQLGQQVVSDLQGSAGSPGYLFWVASLIIVGAIGYYSPLQKFSRAFMVLILLGMVLAAYKQNNQVFAKIFQALQTPQVASAATPTATPSASPMSTATSALSSGTSELQTAMTVIDAAALFA